MVEINYNSFNLTIYYDDNYKVYKLEKNGVEQYLYILELRILKVKERKINTINIY